MKPVVLAVDTTHEIGSLALAHGEALIEQVSLQAPGGFAHVIYGHLASLLERHGLEPDGIDCFAAASGPGSFTGVRVGLACIKGLAEACGKPALGISNLRAMARYGSHRLRAPVLDARRGEVYGAVYDSDDGLVTPETVAPISTWLASLPEEPVEFVAMEPIGGWLAGTRFERAPVTTAPAALAEAIARIACGALVRGDAADPASLEANYVRRSDAELFWKE